MAQMARAGQNRGAKSAAAATPGFTNGELKAPPCNLNSLVISIGRCPPAGAFACTKPYWAVDRQSAKHSQSQLLKRLHECHNSQKMDQMRMRALRSGVMKGNIVRMP